MAKKETEVKEEKIDVKKLKKELSEYIEKEIKDKYSEEIEKSKKRVIKRKNKKILVRNIIIILLSALIIYLLYLLNTLDYFDKYFLEDNNVIIVPKETKEETKSKEEDNTKEPSLEELIKEYGNLLNGYYINENSSYIKDYYNGNLTNELKNYLALNNLNLDNLTKENNYHIIDEELLKKEYEKLFSDNYTSTNFNYNGNNIRYITVLKSYISDKLIEKNNSNIARLITNIDIDDDEIKITVTEGIAKEKKVYNILTKEEIGELKEETFTKESKKLNQITYIFNKDKKLINLKTN